MVQQDAWMRGRRYHLWLLLLKDFLRLESIQDLFPKEKVLVMRADRQKSSM